MAEHLGFPIETVLVFALLAVGAFFIDMGMHRDNKPIPLKSASLWSVFWVAVSLAFAGFLFVHHGKETATLFITGYALEKVLSVDNLFVIMAIFSWFKIPDGLRHRVLYWGIIGAIVFRGIFVTIGTGLLAFGPWVEMLFAAVVLWTAYAMMTKKEEEEEIEDYSHHPAYRAIKSFMPVWPKLTDNGAFLLTQAEVDAELAKPENAGVTVGRPTDAIAPKGFFARLLAKFKAVIRALLPLRYATPLLLCLAVIELSDVMFAFDSVPAVIAVSKEPLIVFSSMMFAILGLRTLYFVLEALKSFLVHLEKAVIVLLYFIGAKLALNASAHIYHHNYEISAMASLMVVLVVLTIGIVASLMFPEKEAESA
ncbi:Inner membrane protein alx [compost metagenome]